MTAAKVFISNLNYATTEDELKEYLGGEATNVFIPNYFVGFRSLKAKPLGIAYADLPSPEAAEEFIGKFDGAEFKERKLRARPHVPYLPDAKTKAAPKSPSSHALAKLVSGHKAPKEEKDESKKSEDQEYTHNSLFLKGLKAKTTESHLRDFFKEYNPTEIKIHKLRGWIRGLKNRSYNAVVVLDLPPDKSIDEVIEESKTRKHEWLFLSLMKAYASKEKKSAGKAGEEAAEVNDSREPTQKAANIEVEAKPEGEAKPEVEAKPEGEAKPELVAKREAEESKKSPEGEAVGKPQEEAAGESLALEPSEESPAIEEIKSSAENVIISKSSDTTPAEV